MSLPSPNERRRGLFALLVAFSCWGLLPLYLRPLRAVPALEVMCYRLVFCCLCVLAVLAWRGELGLVRDALRSRATRLRLCASALLISCNWLLYVWAVTRGHVVEASLGYFVNPLVNVLLGVVVLGERLVRVQWLAVALAALGVVYLGVLAGTPPWIALSLAASFGSYGLIRKMVAVEALVGLGSETLLIAPLGIVYLVVAELTGHGVPHDAAGYVLPMLILSGPLTAIPLAAFAFGARRIPYSTVGIVQYGSPTIQLLLGIFVFGERFADRAVGFVMIWVALAIYAAHGVLRALPAPSSVPPRAGEPD